MKTTDQANEAMNRARKHERAAKAHEAAQEAQTKTLDSAGGGTGEAPYRAARVARDATQRAFDAERNASDTTYARESAKDAETAAEAARDATTKEETKKQAALAYWAHDRARQIHRERAAEHRADARTIKQQRKDYQQTKEEETR
jgi:hypothetical protein